VCYLLQSKRMKASYREEGLYKLTSAAMCVVVDRAASITFAGKRTAGATKPLATPSAATTEKARVLVILALKRE
jgi:hypothetical protein